MIASLPKPSEIGLNMQFMSKIKSNPYVYPYVSFRKLAFKKSIRAEDDFVAEEREILISDVRNVLDKIKKISIEYAGKSIEEKIFSVFLNESVLFGPKNFVENKRDFWLEKIRYFVNRNKRIRFTLLGFPFKIPVPLKTNRRYPDMGEALILFQLNNIIQSIQQIYAPAIEIVVFTEGGLGKFVGISKQEADEYKKYLILLNNKLGFSKSIKIKDLSDMEKEKNFDNLFKDNLKYFKIKLKKGDSETIKKYEGAGSSIFKIINTRKEKEAVLMDVYNEKIQDKDISRKALAVRNHIRRKMNDSVLGYFAYLRTRDDVNYLEKIVPHYLALSVSPKLGRLGIIPVNNKSNKLPYHAVTIFDPKNNFFYLDYLIDMKCGKDKYEAIYLKGDIESIPFYYVKIN
jgi:pyoverdine/dityrosine biosynthesis protein Dit1